MNVNKGSEILTGSHVVLGLSLARDVPVTLCYSRDIYDNVMRAVRLSHCHRGPIRDLAGNIQPIGRGCVNCVIVTRVILNRNDNQNFI